MGKGTVYQLEREDVLLGVLNVERTGRGGVID